MIRTTGGPGIRPRSFDDVLAWMLRRGVPLPRLRLLETRGRRSGRTHAVPVLILPRAGHRFLVAPRGRTNWALNLRATPRAELVRGRRREVVAVEELEGEPRVTVVLAYLEAYGWLTRKLFGLSRGHTPQQVAEIAADHPTFRLGSAPD